MHKKAQGLSLNTIIVAIIVLIVLVVLIMIFTGYFGARFTPEVTSCPNAGGVCQSKDLGCGIDAFNNKIPEVKGACLAGGKPDPSQICCARGLGQGAEVAEVIVLDCGDFGGLCKAATDCDVNEDALTGTNC